MKDISNMLFSGLNIFIDIQTSKTLIQMDINKMMRMGIYTMKSEHIQLEGRKK